MKEDIPASVQAGQENSAKLIHATRKKICASQGASAFRHKMNSATDATVLDFSKSQGCTVRSHHAILKKEDDTSVLMANAVSKMDYRRVFVDPDFMENSASLRRARIIIAKMVEFALFRKIILPFPKMVRRF